MKNKIKEQIIKAKQKHLEKSSIGSDLAEIRRFEPSDNKMPLMKAMENIQRFQEFMGKCDDVGMCRDGFEEVERSVQEALRSFGMTAEKKKKGIKDSNEAMAQFGDQVKEHVEKREKLIQHIQELKEKIPEYKELSVSKQRELSAVKKRLYKISQAESVYHRIVLQREDLRCKLFNYRNLYKETRDNYKSRTEELNSQAKSIFAKIEEVNKEIAESDNKIKGLLVETKEVIAKENILKERRGSFQSMPSLSQLNKKPKIPERKSVQEKSFVIEDNVKISNSEIDTLKYMVDALDKENSHLHILIESKLVDIKCISDENEGLKQIIREMTE